MLAKLTIGTRLSLLLLSLLFAILAVGGYGVYALQRSRELNAAGLRLSADLLTAVESVRSAEVSFKLQGSVFKDLLLRGHDPKDYDRYMATLPQRVELARKQFGAAREAIVRLGIATTAVDEAIRLHGEITQAYLDSLKDFEVANKETSYAVDRKVRGRDRPLQDKVDEVVNGVQQFADGESARLAEAGEAASRRAITSLVAALALAAAWAAVAGTWLIRGLLRELGGEPAYAKEVAERIAQGDLSLDVQVRSGDRGSMLLAMKKMADNLRALVGEVAGSARDLAGSSAQIAQGNADLSQRTEEQASTLEETASQMEELTSTVSLNTDNAREASRLAGEASAVARRGGEVVGEVVATMNGISAASHRIADIIGVIDGIAFQTNILALNAAVEAARAGDQGRGFAVVAAEVRNLAQRSASAAKEIKALIADSAGRVEAGAQLVDVAGKTMEDIVGSVKKVSDLVTEIAAASQEQGAGIEQVNTAVAQMDQVVQQNASLVEEAAAATESMRGLAGSLLRLVGRFRLGAEAAPAPQDGAPPPAIRFRPASAKLARVPLPAAAGEGAWKAF